MTGGELGRSWKSFGGDRGRVWRKGRRGQQSLGGQRGQSNFELAAHKVLSAQALSPAAVL